MGFLVLFFSLVLVCIGLLILDKIYDWWFEEAWTTFLIIFSICLAVTSICAFALPYNRSITIEQIEQQRETVHNIGNDDAINSITYLETIMTVNDWIIRNQEKNKSFWFDMFIPDEIENVELLE